MTTPKLLSKLRVALAALLLVALPAPTLRAAGRGHDWDRVMGVRPGRAVKVKFAGRTVQGELVSVASDQLVVRTKKEGEVTAARVDIRRVWLVGHRHNRNALIGAAIGGAGALGPGMILREYANNEVGGGGKWLAGCLAIGIVAGMAAGAAFGGREVIYKGK